MTLTLRKLTTTCRALRGVQRASGIIEDAVHGELASELRAQLGPSLDRLPAVVRMKQLRVKLRVPSRNLNSTTLAGAWARAFTLALHNALAYPPGDGVVSSRRHDTDAAYRAALLHHIATKGLAPSWEFPELEHWSGSTPADAARAVFLEKPALVPEIAAWLERHDGLEALLSLWNDLQLEQVMQVIAGNEQTSGALSLDNLIALGNAAAAAGGLRSEWAFAGRRQSLRLWTRFHPRLPLREVWHGLRLLQRFLEKPALLILCDPSLLADSIPFPSWCDDIVRGGFDSEASTRWLPRANRSPLRSPAPSDRLRAVLETLRSHVPSAASFAATGARVTTEWIVSSRAGILLMLSTGQNLDLWRLTSNAEFAHFGGPRALSFLLAGIGMTLFKPWSSTDPLDPAITVFAGMLAEPDRAGMSHFFAECNVRAVEAFVQAETWPEALEQAATEFARSFAGRLRGFRQASRQSVVKQFLSVPGRVLIEETRILVVLEHTPWNVALHLSSLDAPLASVEWLGRRRVEFVLEGL